MYPFPPKAKPHKLNAFTLPAMVLLSPDMELKQENWSYSSYSALMRKNNHTVGMMDQKSRGDLGFLMIFLSRFPALVYYHSSFNIII